MSECLKNVQYNLKQRHSYISSKEERKKGVRKRNTPGLQLWRDLSSNPRFCHLLRV